MDHVIIDGYNLIHAVPSLKKTLLHNAESARELLIHAVAQLTHKRKFRCSIVFDGHEPPARTKQSVHAPVHVIYSGTRTADSHIRTMIEQSKQRPRLVIVSSDREIIAFAQACSCQTHSSRHFANLLSEADDAVTDKSDSTLTPHQIDEWLRIFGEK
ncbi:MAG: NYN domain-containing protein [Bacteroidetes bacterium]|nr:NYN domain-containing protein [Bacteroidota bacterium]